MVIEYSIRCADDCFTVPLGIPRHPEAWLNVVGVGLNSFLQAQQAIRRSRESLRRLEGWRYLNVIADAVVESDIRIDAPRILPECANGNVLEGVAGTTEALNELSRYSKPVGLHGRKLRD